MDICELPLRLTQGDIAKHLRELEDSPVPLKGNISERVRKFIIVGNMDAAVELVTRLYMFQ